jgi:3-deoxy-D-manno-octulosonic-acid transferase
MNAGELLLGLYRGAGRAASPLAPLFLNWRRRRGKEHPTRWTEKLGRPSLPRPLGGLVWMHGASVGETVSLLPLVSAFCAQGFAVLVTSGTPTSARVMQTRLPAGAMHQFAPLDTPAATRAFLDHWRPAFGMIAESELWPTWLVEAKARGVPLFLVNARMSARSYGRWRKRPELIEAMLGRLDGVFARSKEDAERYLDLGARPVEVAGNLKYDAAPLPADPAALAELAGAVGARAAWAAASTHPGEEEAALAAHLALKSRFPDLLTLIAPRHPERGEEAAALAAGMGLAVTRRSRRERPQAGTDVHLVDTMGELGLLYRAAPVALVGGTLAPIGGHSPIEPAKLGVAVLHGPHVDKAQEEFDMLDAAGGALAVADADGLAETLADLLGAPARMRAVGRAASEAVERRGGATRRVLISLAARAPSGEG